MRGVLNEAVLSSEAEPGVGLQLGGSGHLTPSCKNHHVAVQGRGWRRGSRAPRFTGWPHDNTCGPTFPRTPSVLAPTCQLQLDFLPLSHTSFPGKRVPPGICGCGQLWPASAPHTIPTPRARSCPGWQPRLCGVVSLSTLRGIYIVQKETWCGVSPWPLPHGAGQSCPARQAR